METLTSVDAVLREMDRLTRILADDMVELQGLKVEDYEAQIAAKRDAIGTLDQARKSLTELHERTEKRDRQVLTKFSGIKPKPGRAKKS